MTTGFLVGRGIADVTGEAAGCGMLGYGKAGQVTAGIHLRLRSRSFVIAEAPPPEEAAPAAEAPRPGKRVLIIVAELPLMFDSVRQAVLDRLATRFGDLYTDDNVLITVTHTHSGPGGYACHRLYNVTTHGFHPKTFAAIVDGITESAVRAHEDLAPAELYLTRGELHDASANRSPSAFARNPEPDRAVFPDAIDPLTTLLRVERDGQLTGAINWFATHGTSMTNTNRLISSDNKGYAAYHWERLVHGVDYLADPAEAPFIGAFAQTNAGDMSPNLTIRQAGRRSVRRGPTDDETENTRIIGTRQYEAAAALATQKAPPVTGGVDYRLAYLDLSDVPVLADGAQHRTTPPFAGAAALAGTDEGRGFGGFRPGRNPGWDVPSRLAYALSPRLRDGQAPKTLIVPGGLVNRMVPIVQERVPVQLIRIGPLYLVGVPGEVTIVSGLRLRRAVADALGADLCDVLAAGYSNGYIHYITTPEEYLEQRYEGGSTLFGRWELPALEQAVRTLATAMRDATPVPRGPRPPHLTAPRAASRLPADHLADGQAFGTQTQPPRPSYHPREQVEVQFAAAHLANDLHRGGTYLQVQRATAPEPTTETEAVTGAEALGRGGWVTVADDGDWSTVLRWRNEGSGRSAVTIIWTIPGDAEPGTYRIRFDGDAADTAGAITPFTGASDEFSVAARPT
jgi:neutral ceramidase